MVFEEGFFKQPQPSGEAKQEGGQENSKDALNEDEWGELLQLNRMPPAELFGDKERMARFQELMGKGAGSFGGEAQFKSQLVERQQKESQELRAKEQRKGAEMLSRIEGIVEEAKKGGRGILDEFKQRQVERQAGLAEREAKIRAEMALPPRKTPEEILNDPSLAPVKAKIDWLKLMAGESGIDVDPQLKQEIEHLRMKAKMDILRDPTEFSRRQEALKRRFFESRGVKMEN